MKQLKEEIKTLSSEQKKLKLQRKTVNFEGERTISPQSAASQVMINKFQLRHFFAAYAIIRGKELPKPKKAYLSDVKVQDIVKEYSLQKEPIVL